MKIVYVGDNRNRMNFGCRATSTALSQMLSEKHEIVGRVHGNFRNTDTRKVFFVSWLPSGAYRYLGRKKHWDILKEWFIALIHILKRMRVSFSTFDFISFDFEKSIKNLIKCLPANEILKECDLRQYDFDALVVNGEGSFVFSKIPWRESAVEAMLMYWALKMGKKVFFLNGMFSATPGEEPNYETLADVKDLFEKIDFVGVREKQSYEFAKKHFPQANLGLYPDALFTWWPYVNDTMWITNGRYFIGHDGASDESFSNFDFSKPYMCVSGSSSASITKDREKTVVCYCKLVLALKKALKINVYIVVPCDIDNFLIEVGELTHTPVITVDTPILAAGKILANASVYITGRYHPSILASLGGTPCVFMDSNSHKNVSLQEILNYENPHEHRSLPDDEEIEAIIREARIYLSAGESVRERIKGRAKELAQKASFMTSDLESNVVKNELENEN